MLRFSVDKYNAQGLIEAIIAILIAGMAVVALMAVATQTLGEVARNEIYDQITQESVLGSNMVDHIVELRNDENPIVGAESLFSPTMKGRCFHLDGSLYLPTVSGVICTSVLNAPGEYSISPKQCLTNWDNVKIDDRSGSSDYDYSDTMFRLVCVDEKSKFQNDAGIGDEDPIFLIARIYTGTRSCEGIDSPSTNIDSVDEDCVLNEYVSIHPLDRI